jgi:hypothetical protein
LETVGQAVAADLSLTDAGFAGDVVVVDAARAAVGVDAVVDKGSEEAGFEGGAAEQGELGEGDAFDGEELLGVDGLVEVEEIGFEVVEGVDVFEEDGREPGGGEAVWAGMRSGARAGGSGCIGGL